MELVALIFLVINVISVLAVSIDKSAARNGRKRVKESSLLFLAAIGGGISMYTAMRIIRHKTRKNKFMVGIPAIVLFEMAALAIIYFNFLK